MDLWCTTHLRVGAGSPRLYVETGVRRWWWWWWRSARHLYDHFYSIDSSREGLLIDDDDHRRLSSTSAELLLLLLPLHGERTNRTTRIRIDTPRLSTFTHERDFILNMTLINEKEIYNKFNKLREALVFWGWVCKDWNLEISENDKTLFPIHLKRVKLRMSLIFRTVYLLQDQISS